MSLQALAKLHRSAANLKADVFRAAAASLGGKNGASLKDDLDSNSWKPVLKDTMNELLPLAPAVLGAVLHHVPSSYAAMASGARLDVFVAAHARAWIRQAVLDARASGPLVAMSVKGTLLVQPNAPPAVGAVVRVLSGVLRSGQKVKLLPSTGGSLATATLERIVVLNGSKRVEHRDTAVAGDVVVLRGLDRSADASVLTSKSFAIFATDVEDAPKRFPFHRIPHRARPIVGVALKGMPTDGKASRRVSQSISMLQSVDPCVKSTMDKETKETLVFGSGELHLEVTLAALRELSGIEKLSFSNPTVSYRETVTAETEKPFQAKSTSKLNRVEVVARPLHEGLVEALEAGRLTPRSPDLQRLLVELYGWEPRRRGTRVGLGARRQPGVTAEARGAPCRGR